MEPVFDHERLDVYQLARQYSRELRPLLESIPRGWADSRDNLKRAATSITRNIAEDGGKWKIPDKVHFYHIARASATESAASLDELVDYELMSEDRVRRPKEMLSRIVAMLVGMIRSIEARETGDMRPRARPERATTPERS
jgi:four helix bundle protein